MKQNIGDVERMTSGAIGVALAAFGLSRKSPLGILMALGGASLVARAATGHCPLNEAAGIQPDDKEAAPWNRNVRVKSAITIMKPRQEVYAFWRKLENLPRFMRHLESVVERDAKMSDWSAKAPAGRQVSWTAEITDEAIDERIAWQSVEGADVPNEGVVLFEDAPGGRGTIVRVDLSYSPPAGAIGAFFAKLFGEEPKGQIADDLRRLRAILEAGEVPTTDGQPSDIMRKTKRQIGSAPGAALMGKAMEREATVK
jgi:uncharacterized membrane protein